MFPGIFVAAGWPLVARSPAIAVAHWEEYGMISIDARVGSGSREAVACGWAERLAVWFERRLAGLVLLVVGWTWEDIVNAVAREGAGASGLSFDAGLVQHPLSSGAAFCRGDESRSWHYAFDVDDGSRLLVRKRGSRYEVFLAPGDPF